MAPPHGFSLVPSEPSWDIRFTRLTQAVRPRLEQCARDLGRRFQAIGLCSELQVRQTPRGLSFFLVLIGQRGLVCIIDMSLVDGTPIGQGPRALLDIRLLDACGEVAAVGLASAIHGRSFRDPRTALTVINERWELCATGIFVGALAHFDLLQPVARCG
jgi:hypothetical protein